MPIQVPQSSGGESNTTTNTEKGGQKMFEKFLKIAESRMSVSRREVLQTLAAAGIGVALTPLGARTARAEDEAVFFTWGGYDIDDFQTHYINKHGQAPKYAVYADAEEALQKLRAGFPVDVAFPCSGDIPRWLAADVIEPIDTSRVSTWPNLFEVLKNTPNFVIDGKNYVVPMNFGTTSVIYRTDLVELPDDEESWGILWDERYKGRIGILDSAADSWFCAAIYAGISPDKILQPADIEKTNDLLRKLRPQVRMYTIDGTAMEQGLASGEIVACLMWSDTAVSLRSQGVPVKLATPKEGAFKWSCGLVLAKNAPHPDKAYDLIDSLTSPEAGKYMISEFGYGHANQKAFDLLDDATLERVGLPRDPAQMLAQGKIFRAQPNDVNSRIEKDWEQIKAGF
jgi:spermidine/putrescine transport system substrate-binding protein